MSEPESVTVLRSVEQIFEERLKDFIQHCCVYNDNGDMVMKRAKVKAWFGITDE